eukprot:TRINITY_DN1317_c0_g1_i1.p1 TRINITY_DN1317_c0_g1~~TRINITY_DN1317_c0_g1_i1.p1  ORF type:complete len:301 (-),score=40.40 TRINITY_DN1317_c0_g1_i1:181-1083(-)
MNSSNVEVNDETQACVWQNVLFFNSAIVLVNYRIIIIFTVLLGNFYLFWRYYDALRNLLSSASRLFSLFLIFYFCAVCCGVVDSAVMTSYARDCRPYGDKQRIARAFESYFLSSVYIINILCIYKIAETNIRLNIKSLRMEKRIYFHWAIWSIFLYVLLMVLNVQGVLKLNVISPTEILSTAETAVIILLEILVWYRLQKVSDMIVLRNLSDQLAVVILWHLLALSGSLAVTIVFLKADDIDYWIGFLGSYMYWPAYHISCLHIFSGLLAAVSNRSPQDLSSKSNKLQTFEGSKSRSENQ